MVTLCDKCAHGDEYKRCYAGKCIHNNSGHIDSFTTQKEAEMRTILKHILKYEVVSQNTKQVIIDILK